MGKRFSFFIIIVFTCAGLHAQVLNIESARFLDDSDGWRGQTQLDFSAQQNVNEVIGFGNTIHVQYRKGCSRFILLNDISFSNANGSQFVNTGFQHLRYNYTFRDSSRWTWEAFVQTQYNKPMKMDFRGVTGTGPRFRVLKSKRVHLYLASLYIFEHEIDEGGELVYNDHRLSSYVSFTWQAFKNAEVINTLYYQPLFADFNDYRIAEEFSFSFDITRHFGFGTSFSLLEDTKQPEGIPNLSWLLRQRFTFSL